MELTWLYTALALLVATLIFLLRAKKPEEQQQQQQQQQRRQPRRLRNNQVSSSFKNFIVNRISSMIELSMTMTKMKTSMMMNKLSSNKRQNGTMPMVKRLARKKRESWKRKNKNDSNASKWSASARKSANAKKNAMS